MLQQRSLLAGIRLHKVVTLSHSPARFLANAAVSNRYKVPTVKYTGLFIDNQFVKSSSGKTFADINPANGEKIADIAEADKADIDKAVDAARKAFRQDSVWRTMDASERAKHINKLADLLERDADIVAGLDVLDVGKPFEMAKFDVVHSVSVLRYFAGWCDKIAGQTVPVDGPFFTYTRREPVGVCAAIIPWNFPIGMLSWKIAPALACGCTMIVKPAELSPLSALHVGSLAVEAGFPPGVLQIVPGFGHTAGAALSHHPHVDKIAFTGSTQVGKSIMKAAAESNLKRVTLELGGKSPLIVLGDAENLQEVASIAHRAIMDNSGQVCSAASRTYVDAKVYDEFVHISKKLAEERKIGDPFERDVLHGPQVDEKQFEKVLKYIEIGKQEGARLVTGGGRVPNTRGYYVQPTVFADVRENMRIAKEEIFGPVQSIMKFDSLEDVIERANQSSYGLAAAVFTSNLDRALSVAHSFQAGMIWVNTYDMFTSQMPFGGYKQSGFGRELGEAGLQEYTELKTISIKMKKKL